MPTTVLRLLSAIVFAAVFFVAGFSIGHDKSAISPAQAGPATSSAPAGPDESVPTGFHVSNKQINYQASPQASPAMANPFVCGGSCNFDISISATAAQARATGCDPGYYYCALISNPSGYVGATWDTTVSSASNRNIYLRVEWGTPPPH